MDFLREFSGNMDEDFFAEVQRISPWFNGELLLKDIPELNYEELKNIKDLEDILDKGLDFFEAKRIVFAKIFGTSGFPINLLDAEKICLELLDCFEQLRPKKIDIENGFDLNWLLEFASTNILLGTVYAYKKDYIKASYHFLVGMKEQVVNLNMPYCDFINYVILKLKNIKKSKSNYDGVGFSSENFMGFPIRKEDPKFLLADTGKSFIPMMRGKNGEEIVAYNGRAKFYGFLDRVGSIHNNDIDVNIDIYNTLVIDKNYNLKEVVLYFNNYATHGCSKKELIPADGFKFFFIK